MSNFVKFRDKLIEHFDSMKSELPQPVMSCDEAEIEPTPDERNLKTGFDIPVEDSWYL